MAIIQVKALRKCDFCGRDEGRVGYLIESESGVHICDQCVFKCAELLEQRIAEDEERLAGEDA